MENKNKITDNLKSVLKGNTMIFILVGVMILFEILIRSFGHGSLFAPANITKAYLLQELLRKHSGG